MAFSTVVTTQVVGGLGGIDSTGALDTTGAGLLEVTVINYGLSNPDFQPSVSDSKGNTWNALTRYFLGEASVRKFYALCDGAGLNGTNHTVTVNAANGNYYTFFVRAYAGNNIAFHSEAGNAVEDTTSISAGQVTPPQDNSLVTTGLCLGNSYTNLSVSGGSLAIIQQQAYVNGTTMGGAHADEVQTTATARNPQWSWTNIRDAAACTACFIEGGAALASAVSASAAATADLLTPAQFQANLASAAAATAELTTLIALAGLSVTDSTAIASFDSTFPASLLLLV